MTNAFAIIRNGRLVDARRRLAEPADILIKGDSILSIGPPGLDAPEDAALIDASDRALMPGLVNAHVHGHGTLAKGLVGDCWPLELFLNAMPGMAGNRTIEDKYLNGLVAAVEMIRKGCTACYDLFFEFPIPSLEGLTALGRAYRDAGIRAVIAPMLADKTLYQAYPGLIDAMPEALRADVHAFRLAPYEAIADAVEKIYADWPFDRDWIRPAIAPTIPLHCSDTFLIRCRDLARAYGLPLQTHLAETKAQAVLGLRKYGKTLTAHLDALGMLGPHLSAAHAIWLDRADLSRLADNGAPVVHAPVSNMRFGSGEARTTPAIKAWADAYLKRFSIEPDGLALGQYDGVMMALTLTSKGAKTAEDLRAALQKESYQGVAMTYKSNGRGDLAHDAEIVCWDGTSRIPKIVAHYAGDQLVLK
jgi:5-methylthioadenosine/S-adenosylhomocysteine deaminase